MASPDITTGDQGIGGGHFESEQLAQEKMNSVDDEVPDAVVNPLPQFQGRLPL